MNPAGKRRHLLAGTQLGVAFLFHIMTRRSTNNLQIYNEHFALHSSGALYSVTNISLCKLKKYCSSFIKLCL